MKIVDIFKFKGTSSVPAAIWGTTRSVVFPMRLYYAPYVKNTFPMIMRRCKLAHGDDIALFKCETRDK